jgi:hypothetical protein
VSPAPLSLACPLRALTGRRGASAAGLVARVVDLDTCARRLYPLSVNDPKSDPTWIILLALVPQFLLLFWPAAIPYLGWTVTVTVFGFLLFCAYAYAEDWIRERRRWRQRQAERQAYRR